MASHATDIVGEATEQASAEYWKRRHDMALVLIDSLVADLQAANERVAALEAIIEQLKK